MICPVCKYEYKYRYNMDEKEKKALPLEGDFFYSPKKMRRNDYDTQFHRKESAELYACPKCGVAFIETAGNEVTS